MKHPGSNLITVAIILSSGILGTYYALQNNIVACYVWALICVIWIAIFVVREFKD